MSLLRPITPADHAFVLALNHEHVELLAPMDQARLDELLALADVAAVIGDGDGFVLTMPAGSAYDSPNYRWFSEHYDDFGYLDRIVLAGHARRRGLGSRVYDEIEARVAQVAPRLCLEVNLDPPNEASLAFHRGRGYDEVGVARAHGHTVSLMVRDLAHP